MGLRNMAAFTASSGTLSPAARVLGAFLALHTMDQGTANGDPGMVGLYARGWQYAAAVLWPDKTQVAAQRAFHRGVSELVAKGFLVAEGHAHRGSRQHYRLKM